MPGSARVPAQEATHDNRGPARLQPPPGLGVGGRRPARPGLPRPRGRRQPPLHHRRRGRRRSWRPGRPGPLGGDPSPEARAAVAAFLDAAPTCRPPRPPAPPASSWPPAARPPTSAWPPSTTSAGRSPASPRRLRSAELARVEERQLVRPGGQEAELVVGEGPAGGGLGELDELEHQVLVARGEFDAEAVEDVAEAGLAAVLAGEDDPALAGRPVVRERPEGLVVVQLVVVAGL